MHSLKASFNLELRRARALVKKIYTGKRQLKELPNALRHFLLQSGFAGMDDIHQTKIEWKTAALRFNKTGPWNP